MAHQGLFFVVQIFNILFWVAWPVLALLALRGLRYVAVQDTARVLWALLILVIPVFGALAFWIVKPGGDRSVG